MGWWNHYDHSTPVVVGHYWRRRHAMNRASVGKEDEDLFAHIAPTAWRGRRGNARVDYPVGGSWRARLDSEPPHAHFKLAALRAGPSGCCNSTTATAKPRRLWRKCPARTRVKVAHHARQHTPVFQPPRLRDDGPMYARRAHEIFGWNTTSCCTACTCTPKAK